MCKYINKSEGIWPKLENAEKFSSNSLWGEVVPISGYQDLKPSLAVISENELVMFTIHRHIEHDTHGANIDTKSILHTVMYRSHDGGKTWDQGRHTPIIGYEASVTVIDGVMYVQTHHYPRSWEYDLCEAYIYTSDDMGETWTKTVIDPAFFGCTENKEICCT